MSYNIDHIVCVCVWFSRTFLDALSKSQTCRTPTASDRRPSAAAASALYCRSCAAALSAADLLQVSRRCRELPRPCGVCGRGVEGVECVEGVEGVEGQSVEDVEGVEVRRGVCGRWGRCFRVFVFFRVSVSLFSV